MFAYCHNNPVVYTDPSGYIIALSQDVTEEQEEEYERAIAYLKTSETGRKLIECIETSEEVFTIVFINNSRLGYEYSSNTIYFDVYSGLIVGDGISTQSAALGLAHEMGHAAQDLDGLYDNFGVNQDMREAMNLVTYETPIATELGEPTRSHYFDYIGTMRMQNSIHYITKGQRPWWHYIAFWNWGKPKKIAIDNNL